MELDPDSGCLTYTITDVEDIVAIEETEDWDDLLDDEEEDDSLYEDDDEPFDDWDDDDDDDF